MFGEAVRRLIMHLTQGWADGRHDTIQYWEIGNEPDLEVFGGPWPVEFYSLLYAAAAKAVKSLEPPVGHPPYKVGGPALAYLRGWEKPFLEYCDAHEVPLDFFSFHAYLDDPNEYRTIIRQACDLVRQYPQYQDTMLSLNEWNLCGETSDKRPVTPRSGPPENADARGRFAPRATRPIRHSSPFGIAVW